MILGIVEVVPTIFVEVTLVEYTAPVVKLVVILLVPDTSKAKLGLLVNIPTPTAVIDILFILPKLGAELAVCATLLFK